MPRRIPYSREDPDRSCVRESLHVDLWRGIFRDEVRVWQDVRPATGGLIASETVWRGHGDELFELVIKELDLA